MHKEWGYLTVREISEAWIVKYNKITGQVRWRNSPVVENISEEKILQIENYIKKICINGRKSPK